MDCLSALYGRHCVAGGYANDEVCFGGVVGRSR